MKNDPGLDSCLRTRIVENGKRKRKDSHFSGPTNCKLHLHAYFKERVPIIFARNFVELTVDSPQKSSNYF